ncbi:hypothetical protein JOD54_004250 [Actinokineospora baliensis]|uniref:DUF2795 domain-containing protein n=1 Tax=Actinokineospora baliensis TaxID=547056 RepID=UPI00195CAC27|nr:DUF2795 domain-containing protein [Actinokineospora baliensis]MBM7774046.1 hypothetical protein [Actinokineospora baliensis]
MEISQPFVSIDLDRAEFSTAVQAAFTGLPASTSDLLAAARFRRASPEVLAALSLLPQRKFKSARDAWACLATIPGVQAKTK